MPNLLSTPISAVDSDWIASDLYPSLVRVLASLSGGGVLWLCTDSCREGNYLLHRLQVFAQERGRPCEKLLVSEYDPYIFWDDLVGSGDEPATIWRFAPSTIVCIENGFTLPVAFVRRRHNFLAMYARAHNLVLAIPVTHSLRRDLEGSTLIAVPAFSELPEGRRRELASALLADTFPSDDAGRRSNLARDLVAAQPISRVELEAWIDHFAGSDPNDAKPWRIPPRIPRHRLDPADVPTKDQLRSRLKVSMDRLREASVAFSTWRGHPLIREICEPPDPFHAGDPIHWFSGSISYLACYFFDAVDDSFLPLLGWRWNEVSGEIEAAEPLPFAETLRILRTVMQHGIDGQHPRNRETLDAAERWCRAVASAPGPQRDRCRILTLQILRGLEEVVNRLYAVVVHATKGSNRDLIEGQLDLAMRRLPKYRWSELLAEVSSGYGVELDLEVILEANISSLQEKIRKTPLKGSALMDRARELVKDVVVAALARCPVTTDELIAAGIPPGPFLGKAKDFVEKRWREDATIVKEELLRLACEGFLPKKDLSDTPNRDQSS